jgi:protein-tyrosine phosphatase
MDGWAFSSAGLEAEPGTPPPQDAVQVARELGLDLSAHRSRPLVAIDPATIDVVFVMEPTQILRGGLAPFRARSPILMLGSLAGDPLIPDPFGRDPETFRRCFAAIDLAIDRLLELGSSGATRVIGPHPATG